MTDAERSETSFRVIRRNPAGYILSRPDFFLWKYSDAYGSQKVLFSIRPEKRQRASQHWPRRG